MIRSAVQSDIPELSQIHRASWFQAYAHAIPARISDQIPDIHFQRMWKKNLNDSDSGHWVAEHERRIVGFVSVRSFEPEADTGEIAALYIAPGSTGRGFGTALLRHALHELRASGFKKAKLWVVRENLIARKFYERGNFVTTNMERHNYRHGAILTQLQYGLSLEERA